MNPDEIEQLAQRCAEQFSRSWTAILIARAHMAEGCVLSAEEAEKEKQRRAFEESVAYRPLELDL